VRAALGAAAMVVVASVGTARADEPPASAPAADTSNDGYCEFVEGAAAAQADLLQAPTAFASLGYVKEPTGAGAVTSGTRGALGLQYNFVGIASGSATRARAEADCKRHQALDRVQGETVYRALRAKKKIYDEAMAEADKMMAIAAEDLRQHRTVAQDVVAMRVRVNELHDLQSDTARLIDSLPAPSKGESLGGSLAAYYRADAEIEEHEARLRRLSGIDVTARFGFDSYFDRQDDSPVFGVLQVSINLGEFFMGGANDRAMAGRKKTVREQHQVQLVDTTISHIKREIDAESMRSDETAALEQDLEAQISQLDKIGGDESKHYRQTVWFDYVKVKAEHAYFMTHVASLKEVVGQVGD